MTWKVRTTDGAFVADGIPGKQGDFTEEEAKASADERNRRAEELGIATRYEAVEK